MTSKIEWTNETWNVITGCTQFSAGCANCFAKRMTTRLKAMGQDKYKDGFNKVVFHPEELKRNFGKKPRMIFVNSMSDTFHVSVEDWQIQAILDACKQHPQHIFQILTKRATRINDFKYPDNVWLGVTVEAQDYKNRISYLKDTNAKVKFLSCEPLLSDLGELDLSGIDWVIAGGESGQHARPMHPDWVRNIQKQCEKQNVPFFFKQWGEWAPGWALDYYKVKDKFYISKVGNSYCLLNVPISKDFGCYHVGKKYSTAVIDGKEYKQYPKILEQEGQSV